MLLLGTNFLLETPPHGGAILTNGLHAFENQRDCVRIENNRFPICSQRLLMAEHVIANYRKHERTVSHEIDTGTSALFLDVLPSHV